MRLIVTARIDWNSINKIKPTYQSTAAVQCVTYPVANQNSFHHISSVVNWKPFHNGCSSVIVDCLYWDGDSLRNCTVITQYTVTYKYNKTRRCSESANHRQCQNFNQKWSEIPIQIGPDPDVCRISHKMLWIHYVVGISHHFATFHNNQPLWVQLCAIFKLFDVKDYSDLEIEIRGHSLSFEMAPLDRLHTSFYSTSVVIVCLPCTNRELIINIE